MAVGSKRGRKEAVPWGEKCKVRKDQKRTEGNEENLLLRKIIQCGEILQALKTSGIV